jgi:hypothetical protein
MYKPAHAIAIALALMFVLAIDGNAYARGPGGPGGHGFGGPGGSAFTGLPPGFGSRGAAHRSWATVPPGWSKGNKRGWGCTPGTRGCVPPGLR